MLKKLALSVFVAHVAVHAQPPSDSIRTIDAARLAGDTSVAAPSASTSKPAAKPAVAGAQRETPNAIHIHPIATGVTLAINAIPTWWYVTYERELGNGKSITIQPMMITGEFSPEFFGDEDEAENSVKVSQFGVTASYRVYPNGKESRGRFFAPAVFFNKLTMSKDGYDRYNYYTGWSRSEDIELNSTSFGALMYIGYRGKDDAFSWYVDAGLGIQSVNMSITGSDSDLDDIESASGSGLALDVNYGIGLAF